jgi:hypothetical protein
LTSWRAFAIPIRSATAPTITLANLATQSGTHPLGEVRSADFLARVSRRLESLGWPRLTATFVGYLIVGRVRT